MRFLQAFPDAGIFREIPISQADVSIQIFQLVIEGPAHDFHEHSVSKTYASFDRLREFYRSFVIPFVAGFTERDQVIRCIPTCLAAFDMVHIENFVLRPPLAALADMPVAEEYIFTYIPEPELFPLLVLCALYFRILDLLDIERRYLHNDFRYWQYLMYPAYSRKVCINFILYRWCEQSVASFPVYKTASGILFCGCAGTCGSAGVLRVSLRCRSLTRLPQRIVLFYP